MDLYVKLLAHSFGKIYFKRGVRKRNYPTGKISYFGQRTPDQVTILTQHLASDIFISNSLEIIEFAFKTFIMSSYSQKIWSGVIPSTETTYIARNNNFLIKRHSFLPGSRAILDLYKPDGSATYASVIQYKGTVSPAERRDFMFLRPYDNLTLFIMFGDQNSS